MPLADGTYTLTAYAKMGKSFNEMYMYATSGGKTFKTDMNIADGHWHLYTMEGVVVSGGQVEVGFYADGQANNWCHIDDVALVKDSVDNDGDGSDDGGALSVAGLQADGRKSTQYFNLAGKRIEQPSRGIYLVRTVSADGKVACNKKILKP